MTQSRYTNTEKLLQLTQEQVIATKRLYSAIRYASIAIIATVLIATLIAPYWEMKVNSWILRGRIERMTDDLEALRK